MREDSGAWQKLRINQKIEFTAIFETRPTESHFCPLLPPKPRIPRQPAPTPPELSQTPTQSPVVAFARNHREMTSRLPFFSLAFLLLSPLARASPIAHDIAAEAKRSNVFQVRDESIFTPVILISYSTPITSPVNGETFTAGGPGSISWSVNFLVR